MPTHAKIVVHGPSGAGKSTQLLRLLISLHRQTGAPVFFFDTENAKQAADIIFAEAGVPYQILQSDDPTQAYKAVEYVEKLGGILGIDNATDLYKMPRLRWQMEHKKPIPMQQYGAIDRPFDTFQQRLKWAKCHVLYTLKVKADKDTVEENEVVHMVPDGRGLEFVARVKLSMSANKRKGQASEIVALVSDDAAAGKTGRIVSPTQEHMDKIVARFATANKEAA